MQRLQREWLVRSASLAIAGPALAAAVGVAAWGAWTTQAPRWPLVVVGVILATVLSAHLSVGRTQDSILLAYWPFARRHIAVQDIVAAQAVTYRPLRDYGGWGIRWGRGGVAWTVSGSRAVRLDLRNGRHVLIGSRDPHRLLAGLDLGLRPSGR